MLVVNNFNCRGFGPLLEDKLCLIFKLAPSVCRMTFPILASLLVRLVVLLPFQLLRLSLATPYNVLPQLDINNTIDHRPEGDEKWFLENEKTVTQFCRKLAAERPLKDIRDEYNYPKKKGIKDECSRLLEASTMKSRRGFAIQRLMNAMRQA